MLDNNITFVATDAHKLVKYNMSNINIGFENSFILPKKLALTLKNILVHTDELIEINFDDKNISFYCQPLGCLLICRPSTDAQ